MVGDMNGETRGSACRLNEGKVPYELLPLSVVNTVMCMRADPASDVLISLGLWQAGQDSSLVTALNFACGGVTTLPALAAAARVFDYGRTKYASWNWARGFQWSIPMACAIRHCLAILEGEHTDPESGLPHIGHVQCNLLMLLTFAETYPEGDDRPVKWLNVPE